jgi:hypothetical protein
MVDTEPLRARLLGPVTLWLLGDPEKTGRQRDLALAVAEKPTQPLQPGDYARVGGDRRHGPL